jgi:hypothetical protein
MADKAFSQADIETLAAKLNVMDFTDGERSILEALFRTADSEGEVEGFDMNLGSLQLYAQQQTLLASLSKSLQDTRNTTIQKI